MTLDEFLANPALIVIAVIASVVLFFIGWRWASRVWSLPTVSSSEEDAAARIEKS